MNHDGTWIRNDRVDFVKLPAGNYTQATGVEHGAGPAATVVAMMHPQQQRSINSDDLHISLGHTNDANARDTAKQMVIKVAGIGGYCDGCGEAKAIRRAVLRETKVKSGRPLQRVFIDIMGTAERGIVRWWWMATQTSDGWCFWRTGADLSFETSFACDTMPSNLWDDLWRFGHCSF